MDTDCVDLDMQSDDTRRDEEMRKANLIDSEDNLMRRVLIA